MSNILKGFSQIGADDILSAVLGGTNPEAAIDDCLRRDQAVMAALTELPSKHLTEGGAEALTKAGVVLGPVDGLFQQATLPEGWKVKPTHHPMWSDLLDDKGRVRARIFYKSSFWDRDAHIRVMPRFRTGQDGDGEKTRMAVYDGDRIIWATDWLKYPDYSRPRTADEIKEYEAKRTAMEDAATAFILAGWPNWKDLTAYWDV